MKKIGIILISMIVIVSCQAQQQTGLSHMNTELWREDIQQLNQKIQSEFKSFDPTVKAKFAQNIKELENSLSQFDNAYIIFRLTQIVAGLNDGHTEVQFFGRSIGLKRLPISFYFFEEGLYILAAHETYGEYISGRVKAISGSSPDKIFGLLKTLMPHDNDYEILHAGTSFLMLPEVMKYLGITDQGKSVNLSVEKGGKSTEVKVDALPISEYSAGPWLNYRTENGIETPLYATKSDRNYWFEYLENDKTMYFYFGANNDQKGQPSIRKTVKAMFKEVDRLKPDKLVIDVRDNTGGNYHKSEPLIEAIAARPWLNQKNKVYAISSRRTFSAGMTTQVMLKKGTQTTLVGEPSRGNPNKSENVERFNLKNSDLRIEYTTRIKKKWPELGDANKVPIDVPIPVRFEDYIKGLDPNMDYILKQK